MRKTLIIELNTNNTLVNSYDLKAYQFNSDNQSSFVEKLILGAERKIIANYKELGRSIEKLLRVRRDTNRSVRFCEDEEITDELNSNDRSLRDICHELKQTFLQELNNHISVDKLQNWLAQEIGNSLDPCNIILKTDSLDLGSLPWEHCELFNQYYDNNNLTFGLNFASADKLIDNNSSHKAQNKSLKQQKKKTRILVILGDDNSSDESNNNKLNLGFDEQEFDYFKNSLDKLEDRANVEIETVRPSLKELRELLTPNVEDSEQNWDVIYYGGHSNTIENENDGIFFLVNDEQVKISELENDFKNLVDIGNLKLLIVNACQSLGTAYRLINQDLPFAIVMRQSIPDDFAHEYLKYFLDAVANGLPLSYIVQLSRPHVREAFDQGHKIPGASMFPVLCLTPNHINDLDEPIVKIDGLLPIASEMISLANLAKRRLEIDDYRNESAIALQRFYAETLKQKNIVSNEGEKEYLNPSNIITNWRMSGKLIWEITMSANIQGKVLVFGQGYVNVETGNSELLLDNRPSSWTGTEVEVEGRKIAQLKFSKEDISIVINNDEPQEFSVTKLAILILENEYRKFAQSKDCPEDSCNYVRNFGGWLKDFNRKVFQKEFAILAAGIIKDEHKLTEGRKKELINQAFYCTPFGKHRKHLGITEFRIDPGEDCSWKTLKSLMDDDNWKEKDKKELVDEGISKELWQKIIVPDKIIVTEATRPEGKNWNPEIKIFFQQQEVSLFKK